MPSNKPSNAPGGDSEALWLTKHDAARLIGIKPRSFSDTIQPRLPADASRGQGKSLRFFAPSVHQSAVAIALESATGVDGEMLAGGDSPALERYRLANAKLKEMELEERNKTHVDVSKLGAFLVRFGSLLRRTGEIFQRRWGNDAVDVFNNGLEESMKVAVAEHVISDTNGS